METLETANHSYSANAKIALIGYLHDDPLCRSSMPHHGGFSLSPEGRIHTIPVPPIRTLYLYPVEFSCS